MADQDRVLGGVPVARPLGERPRLDLVTGMWTVVEAELNLDVTSNALSRRPPQDYEPFIPESPMGNVLGFQFRPDEGGKSGALSFFRCSGVGRELLLGLHAMSGIDGRPASPRTIAWSRRSSTRLGRPCFARYARLP